MTLSMPSVLDPGSMWDQIVQRNLEKCTEENPTKTSSSTKAKLPLLKEPRPMAEDIPREISQIDQGLRSVLRGLVAGDKPWPLFLTGEQGRGKSAAALCLADYVEEAAYFRFPRLLKSFLWSSQTSGVAVLRQHWQPHLSKPLTWKTENFNEYEFFRFLCRVPLLILDDVATRSGYTDPQYDNVFEVLDDRRRKPTVVVSNLGLEQIGEVFDNRIKSRLAAGTVFTLTGKDRRLERSK